MALEDIQAAMLDDNSTLYFDEMLECMSNSDDTNIVANKLDQYIAQALDRVFTKVPYIEKNKKDPAWYDSECTLKRSQAIETIERDRNSTSLQPVTNTTQLSNASSTHTPRNVWWY